MDGFGDLGGILGGSWVSSWGGLGGLGGVFEGLGGGLVEQGATRHGALTLKGGIWGRVGTPKSIQEGKKSKKRGIKQES